MPGCSAIGCNNRSERGYVMKCFPREPKLRQLWKERVNRADWEPSNNSFLCHMHFEPNQWIITENGKIRLKKDAVPSIFKITKYKRSHKKAIKIDDDCEYNFIKEHSESEVGQLSPKSGNFEDKDSDSQDIDPLHLFLYPREDQSSKMTEDLQESNRQSVDTPSNLQDVIVISDDEIKIETNNSIEKCQTEKQADNKKSADNQDEVVKSESDLKSEQITSNDSYDEIEEKLKQICDGDRDENVSNNKEQNTISNDQKKDLVTKVSFYENVDSKYSSNTGIKDTLANDTENVATIFGSESGEECGRVSNGTSHSNNTINEIDTSDNINNKDEKLEDLEKSPHDDNSHVKAHEKIATKRKMSVEIVTPAKKLNQSVSSQDANSTSNNNISDNIAKANNEMEVELNTSLYMESKKENSMMLQLSSTPKFTIKEHTDAHQGNSNALVTSVIMMDDELTEANVRAEHNYEGLRIASTGNDQMPSLKDDRYPRSTSPHFDEETNDIDMSSECLTPDINRILEQPMVDHTIKYEYRRLQQKVKIQEDVIKELTTQLIKYKDTEKDLRNKKYLLDVKLKKLRNMISAYDGGTDSASSVTSDKKTVSLQKKVFEDLSFTATYVEEANKRLRERLNVETEKKKQLESQVKQKDTKMKELNWKLEKASKYLERAEKNTHKYKRKMLNMQSFLKRKKLADQEISKLGIVMLDNRKGHRSKESLEILMEFKKICGEKGYELLRIHGFPFPELSALKISSKDSLKSNESGKKIPQEISLDIKNDNVRHVTNNKLQSDVNVDLIQKTDHKEVKFSPEIIMGTVQDIFEENNDIDDFSTDEIKEEFILQLDSNVIAD
ncbi:putative leucine-rich repeat-containing protein DDB_G0290503 isoform X2 [Pseudomyrmex gracilis]|uniref:putative leucine-rich repeat-containing protein DDB_G0290503 isoform X2 n=1 Tax=Pseudomyrmex gracilis TaxID=219809 RepID=UPI0009950F44|nr:putative leucine-rich repeat-containing protein DDB_G0290503 isoform X2 [Pseudomyrmex gracilis]